MVGIGGKYLRKQAKKKNLKFNLDKNKQESFCC